jgi:BTB/POZ domain
MSPVPVRDYGSATVTVTVGQEDQAKTYTIHKNLLSQASTYFYGALEGNFRESHEQTLKLGEDCPTIFEVLIQWLYSGDVLEANFYTQDKIPDDVLWLRVYEFADERLVDKLQEEAYTQLKKMFGEEELKVPSLEFVTELFNSEMPHLQQYIVCHSAFWIYEDEHGNWKEWEALMSRVQSYGCAVAVQLAKLHSSERNFKGCREHPAKDEKFDQYK